MSEDLLELSRGEASLKNGTSICGVTTVAFVFKVEVSPAIVGGVLVEIVSGSPTRSGNNAGASQSISTGTASLWAADGLPDTTLVPLENPSDAAGRGGNVRITGGSEPLKRKVPGPTKGR